MKRMIVASRDDRDYFGQAAYEKYHDLVRDNLSGVVISKRVSDEGKPGSLLTEAENIGIDMWDLLECLEGMCYNGEAQEISDYQYKVL